MIEDDFAAGRPAWEAAGAELVADVGPTRSLKLRLLNGAHSAIAYLGALLGLPFVADVMADPALARFVERLMLEEIAPLTPLPPGFDVDGYAQALLRRFANPSAAAPHAPDRDGRLAENPGALVAGAARGPAPRAALPAPRPALAAWLWFPPGPRRGRPSAAARRPDGGAPARGRGTRRARPGGPGPGRLGIEEVFGRDLREDAALVDDLTTALERLTQAGARAALGVTLRRTAVDSATDPLEEDRCKLPFCTAPATCGWRSARPGRCRPTGCGFGSAPAGSAARTCTTICMAAAAPSSSRSR